MPDRSQQNDPVHNPNFRRRWASPLPPSPAELRLAELRRSLGNAEGTRVFREEMSIKKAAWL